MLLRRRMLEVFVALAGGLGLSRLAAAIALPPTPAQTTGPFYPLSLPADADKDPTHIAGREGTARGTITYIAGRVLDRDGRPISGARVEIWQCDANGRYHYVRDDRVGPPPDENFQTGRRLPTRRTGTVSARSGRCPIQAARRTSISRSRLRVFRASSRRCTSPGSRKTITTAC